MCLCVRGKEVKSVCVCLCVRGKECVCVCVCACMRIERVYSSRSPTFRACPKNE